MPADTPRRKQTKPLTCGYGECSSIATEWRYVPFATTPGGIVSAYCPEHLAVVARYGAKPVTCGHLPRLQGAPHAR